MTSVGMGTSLNEAAGGFTGPGIGVPRMISKQLVFGTLAAVALLAAMPSQSWAMAISGVALNESAIGGAPVTPVQLSNGTDVSAGGNAAPLPEAVDPSSVLFPGFLLGAPMGGAVQFTEEPGDPIAGYYTSNLSLAQSNEPFGDRRFFSVDSQTQVSFIAEPSFSIGASADPADFSVSLFRVDGPTGGTDDGTIPATMDVTQIVLDSVTAVNSLVQGANFVSPDVVFGTAVLDAGNYFFDILAATDAANASYKFEIQYQAVQPVPLPAAVWLFLSGIAGLICISRFRRAS